MSMDTRSLAIFALESSRAFAEQVVSAQDLRLAAHEERAFEDGEHKVRPLEPVRGKDVYVIQSLHGDGEQSVNDKLCRLLFFVGALKDAAAARVTVVAPYLCYARKDRKTKARDPVTTRYVAALFEAAGADRVVTMDVHNLAAFQNAFRVATEHLEARKVFVDHFAGLVGDHDVVVVSPDAGGIKRAEQFRESLSRRLGRPVDVAFMHKKRSEGVVSGEGLVGDVAGAVAIVIDDLISSGTTLARAAQACQGNGAARSYVAATHGVFASAANRVIAEAPVEQVVVTSSVPPLRLDARVIASRLTVLDIAPLVAEAICRLHESGSLVDLFAD
jgi:ribose-phosphate pyrophosphokinase